MAKSGFVLAAAQSGAGKTTFATALMAAFRQKHYTVQPFKVGPDYIDPMYHTAAAGRPSRNLDSYMLSPEVIRYLFYKHSADADIAIVEGVMGLYDGLGGDSLVASTAQVAEILDLPVLLLVNGQGMSLSVAALINGYRDFYANIRIGGILLNNVGEGYYHHLKEIIEKHCRLPVFGYLPQRAEFALASRHLGLYCSNEIADLTEKLNALAAAATAHCDLAKLARETIVNIRQTVVPELPPPLTKKVNIGYAWDEAFNFYYQDNLDLLTALGAACVPVSPLRDASLPPLAGLLLGGGYPERYGKELAANVSFQDALKKALIKGLPCFAECGGFIYLGESISYEGETHRLCGFFPHRFVMTDRLQNFGYLEVRFAEDDSSPFASLVLRGHEFHYTARADEGEVRHAYTVVKGSSGKTWRDGYVRGNTLAGYPHFHFWSEPRFAQAFLSLAASYQGTEEGYL